MLGELPHRKHFARGWGRIQTALCKGLGGLGGGTSSKMNGGTRPPQAAMPHHSGPRGSIARMCNITRQLKTYPTPSRAWFSKSSFLGSKLPRRPGKTFQKVGGFPTFWRGFPGPRGSLDPPKTKIENHARPGVGYVPSCLTTYGTWHALAVRRAGNRSDVAGHCQEFCSSAPPCKEPEGRPSNWVR